MPFGVANAPFAVHEYDERCPLNYPDDFVLVFLDDILVYSRTVEIHAKHLGRVLEALR